MAEIDIQWGVNRGALLPSDTQLRHWIETALRGQPADSQVSVRIVDVDEIADLNLRFRHQNKPTNVLSFPFVQGPGPTIPLLGDIIICADVVADEAVAQRKSLEAHWAHMLVHGTLHLLGYDHMEDEDAVTMETIESRILTGLGYAAPYQEIETS